MIIESHEKDMNDLLSKGKTIAEIARKYPQYDCREICWKVNDRSFLGKKRAISNHLKKLGIAQTRPDREELVKEAQKSLDELYKSLKANSEKLIDIDRVMRR